MRCALLIDFGSTFTKAAAVDLQAGTIIGQGRAESTVATDITVGLSRVLATIREQTGPVDYTVRLACSSAAGGLRMIAVGLVPALTAEAARLAALGAGARVLKTYSYDLSASELCEIQELNPEIILLAGGTDGGNRDTIIHNAGALRQIGPGVPVVVAGNKSAADQVREILEEGNLDVSVTENVLPSLGKMNVEPVREAIRSVFLRRIVKAKGLDRAQGMVDEVVMPTPAAVLAAVRLMARGTVGVGRAGEAGAAGEAVGPGGLRESGGMGDLMAVDVGGATTDIYSMSEGEPTRAGTIWRGLREPYAKRTVEGDLGVRYSAESLLEAIGGNQLAGMAGLTIEAVAAGVARRKQDPGYLAQNQPEKSLDAALTEAAVSLAIRRHVGRIEVHYAPLGPLHVQTGKDLSGIRMLIASGGPVIGASDPVELVNTALRGVDDPFILSPRQANVLIDRHYILSAMGLLAGVHPEIALHMLHRLVAEK